MRKLKKPFRWIAITFSSLIICTTVGYLYGPIPVRAAISRFFHNQLGSAPSNNEKPGVYENKSIDPSSDIAVSFYDGSRRHALFHLGVGGDDFRHAAKQPQFDLRVYARSSAEAAQELQEHLTKINFTGGIRMAAVFDHGAEGVPLLGKSRMKDEIYKLLTKYPPKGGLSKFYFYGCNVANENKGRAFMQEIADTYHLQVYANAEQVNWFTYTSIPEGEANFISDLKAWFEATPGGTEPVRLSLVK